MSEPKIGKSVEREARFIRLVKDVLSHKKAGDVILYDEMRAVLDGHDPKRYVARMAAWFRREQQRDLISLPGDGYRVATGNDSRIKASWHERGAYRATFKAREGYKRSLLRESEMTTEQRDVALRGQRRVEDRINSMKIDRRDENRKLASGSMPDMAIARLRPVK